MLRPALLALVMSLAACAGAATDPLVASLRGARYVLLGETHDNAEQHRRRAVLLRELLADGRPARVVFEQLDRDRNAAIMAAPRKAEAVADAGGLDRAAWRWPMHKPLVEAALEGGAKIAGGNVSRAQLRDVVQKGAAAAPADLRPMLDDAGWSRAQQAELESLIHRGHCETLPPDRLAPMALAQRVRDAAMASEMLKAAPSERVVLIAGNGHVRKDVGVPHYLREAGIPSADIAVVGYLEHGEQTDAPFDRTLRTTAANRPDPCAALRK
jgi:uncharacterized iron-regulated protein